MCIDLVDGMRPFVEGATEHFLTLAVGLTVTAYRLLAGANEL